MRTASRVVAIVVLVAVVLFGAAPFTGASKVLTDGLPPRRAPAPTFVRWHHPLGIMSADVPAGWRVSGEINPQAMDQGAFMIQATSPDGKALVVFAHNWVSWMEAQVGAYAPGNRALEKLVLPGIPDAWPGVKELKVAYRGPNRPTLRPNLAQGILLRMDAGVLGVFGRAPGGAPVAGTLMGETMYIPSPGTPGLFRMRIFSGALGPVDAASQADLALVQRRLASSLELAPEFLQAWQQGHAQTVQAMKQYSATVEQSFARYLASMRTASAPRGGQDAAEGWAEMMRGGHYVRDEALGEDVWVSNRHEYWFRNERGELLGNDTGTVPVEGGSWKAMR